MWIVAREQLNGPLRDDIVDDPQSREGCVASCLKSSKGITLT